MIQKPVEWTRRVLTLPAIHPCHSVSPTALLNSLLDLARQICAFKSRRFAANSGNARRMFHLVQNLLIFLGEVRVGLSSSGLPASGVLSFAELHVVFQKLRYLLEDCTRSGASLWMLMRSDQVATHFQVMMQSIATSLDMFPFGSIHLPEEVTELIDLIRHQARNASLRVDLDDIRIVNFTKRILGRFENGLVPDPSDVISVLNHIGIRKWNECNKEIKFLEEEMGKEESESEITLLSSLIGFVCYCRCVMFHDVDGETSNKSNDPNSRDVRSVSLFDGLNTDDFRCPISLEIMVDPVTISTGHTFDRSSIVTWLRSGNPICPITGKRLTSTNFVPNTLIKGLISEYCTQKGIVLSSESQWKKNLEVRNRDVPSSSTAEGAMRRVAEFILNELVSGKSYREISKAVFEARVLTKTSIFYRSCLVDSGAIAPLLNLLSSTHASLQENAMAALLNLSKHARGRSEMMENVVGLDLIVGVLDNGLKMESRQHAAATLFYLASVSEYREVIGEHMNAIAGLIDLVKSNKANERANRNALIAIMGLLVHSENNHWRILASGAVSLLLDLLRSTENGDLISDCLAILASLAGKPDGMIAIVRRGGLSLAVKAVESPASRAAREHGVSLLLGLCVNGGSEVLGTLVRNTGLMGSLYSVVSHGSSEGSKRATALIKILHGYCEKSSSTSSGVAAPTVFAR